MDDTIVLNYTPERGENWIEEAINCRPSIILKKVFTFWKELLILENETGENELEEELPDSDEFETTSFLFAVSSGEYY